jgi:hypothetical protein
MSTARKAVRNTIFFMIKSPNVCGCGRIARRGIIQRHYPLPSGYLENKNSIAYMWDWALVHVLPCSPKHETNSYIQIRSAARRNCVPGYLGME